MAHHMIVAQFHDYAAAHRALCELIQTGVQSNDISIVAGNRSNSCAVARDFGIIQKNAASYLPVVRRGRTLLAVKADEATWVRVGGIIHHHSPVEIAELSAPAIDIAVPPVLNRR